MSLNFNPNWVAPPGDTILNLLDMQQKSLSDFSESLGLNFHETSNLVSGLSPITGQIASELSEFLGGSARFWLNREAIFRERAATQKIEHRYEADWIKAFPYADMAKLGWVAGCRSNHEKAENLFNFFGIQSQRQWHLKYPPASFLGAFHTSHAYDSSHEAVTSWLRQGEKLSGSIECSAWDRDKLRSSIDDIRPLTKLKSPLSFVPRLKDICARCGVALVIAPTPRGCLASGATTFLSQNKALLMLSFRYRSDDQFWFAFFHELAHLILHDMNELFIDAPNGAESEYDLLEKEASDFSANTLIPAHERDRMQALPLRSNAIIRFAVQVGVSPGIVVGQLQKAGILEYGKLNKLKRRYSKQDIARAANP